MILKLRILKCHMMMLYVLFSSIVLFYSRCTVVNIRILFSEKNKENKKITNVSNLSEKIKIVICCIEKGYVFYKNVSALYVPLTYLFTHSVLYGSMY